MADRQDIAGYLIGRLADAGVRHIFGVPGDYVLGFFDRLAKSPLRVINTCDEQSAGFAADAYGRVSGLGAVCATYGVGALKLVNSTAQAYAESSPVIVVSGAPGVGEQRGDPLLHHKAKAFDTQIKIFEQVTAASAVLDDPATAAREVDRVIASARRLKRPVYLELPRDRIDTPLVHSALVEPEILPPPDPEAVAEAIAETTAMLNAARRPVVVAGIQLHRFGLQDACVKFLERTGYPFVSTLLSKSVLGESHPRFAGVYDGGMSRDEVRDFVESADCLLILGAMMTDIDTGIFTARLERSRTIAATAEGLHVRSHYYPQVGLTVFLESLVGQPLTFHGDNKSLPRPTVEPFVLESGRPVKVARLFQCLNAFLTDDTMVMADPGDALFGASDLVIHGATEFLASAYYASLGFAVPAALGAQLATPHRRPLVLVGDGAFQMTGMELAACARYGLDPIVVVLNNEGYGTERAMLDGPFNDIPNWEYSAVPKILGSGRGFKVSTEDQLDAALRQAAETREIAVIDVKIAKDDFSPALARLTNRLRAGVRRG